MQLSDPIYGDVVINEPILEELIKSPPLERLHDISQYGIPDKYFNYKNFTRYQHSVGVMLLLKRLGASLEEQAAGLLHDVSIFAFSHIADMLFGQAHQGMESYHDSFHQQFIQDSKLAKILEAFNLSAEHVSDLTNFSLLENEIPDLCADRIDYALQEFHQRLPSPPSITKCLDGLMNYEGEIVYEDVGSAFEFASSFLRLQQEFWGSEDNTRRCVVFTSVLRRAIDLGIIQEKDFFKTETEVLGLVEASNDSVIQEGLSLLRNPNFPYVLRNEVFHKKFRHVDPKVINGKDIHRLSEINGDFAMLLEQYRENNKEGIAI